MALQITKETRPQQASCQGRVYSRGATLFHSHCCALAKYDNRTIMIFPATDVCLHVAEYSAFAFDCALHGPFGKLRSIRLPPSRTLWVCTFTFISTSTVSSINFLQYKFPRRKCQAIFPFPISPLLLFFCCSSRNSRRNQPFYRPAPLHNTSSSTLTF